MRMIKRAMLAGALALSTTACLDMDVVNQNAPDIERALRDPGDVETVISSSFIIWYNNLLNNDVIRIYPQLADQNTTTLTQRGFQWSREPREPFNNDPQGDQVWIPRGPWDGFSECTANTNDGLRRIKEGLAIRTPDAGGTVVDNTDRAYVFAKLFQGICIGYLGLILDQIASAQEDTIIPAGFDEQRDWEREHLKPYTSQLAMAQQSLDEAIARATSGVQFTTPVTWINQQSLNNQQVIELANTMAARFMVLNARTPAERGQVDWQKVLQHTEKGLTYDFGPTLQQGILTNNNWIGQVNPTGTNTSSGEHRTDYKYLGPADQSGNYQTWLNTLPENRTPFYLSTPDRRVMAAAPGTCTGAPTTAACSPNGAYFRNRGNVSNFDVARGVQYQSFYVYYKRFNSGYGGFTSQTGQAVMASVDENRLLRAEALLRTGQVQAAIDLINVTRTRAVRIGTTNIATNLPPIPNGTSATARLPMVNGACVPRKNDGTCGDIMDALIWERKMELHLQDAVSWWAYARGAGLLLPGTLFHMPIPGRYLVSLLMPIYTHGGIGGTGTAQ
jgi:hypothetical protein